jgi:hypothetical protein
MPCSCPSDTNVQEVSNKAKKLHLPYVEIGTRVDSRGRSIPRTVPATETGDDLPDLSGEPSRNFGCDSNSPVAFALEDPTAGAAFSILPTCKRFTAPRNAEFAAEATESVGLGGLSMGTSDTAVFELDGTKASTAGCKGLRISLGVGGAGDADKEVVEPFMIASLLRKSSNGAPALKSALMVRCERGVPMSTGLRMVSETAR